MTKQTIPLRLVTAMLLVTSLLMVATASSQAQTSPGCCITLPQPNQVDALIEDYVPDYLSATSLFEVTLNSSVGVVPEGTYAAWCVDSGTELDPSWLLVWTGSLISTCDPTELPLIPNHGGNPPVGPPPIVTQQIWNEVNYILNHRAGYFYWDVQNAINTLVGGPPNSANPAFNMIPQHPADVAAMVAAAQANPNYQVPCGGVIGVIFDSADVVIPPSNIAQPVQLLILEVPCTCVQQPELGLGKTASTNLAAPGQPVTYYYSVTNTGGVTVDNINILDDNGTPSDTSDDFTVNAAPFSLTPGQIMNFAIPHITEPLCMPYGGSNYNTGSLTVNVLPNGDVEVFYMQSQGLNDNRYGTNANATTGWVSHTHKFSDLTGSDEATFVFLDQNGKTNLAFQEDYISAATSAKFGDGSLITYPSGYGTLGPLGGDGKMLVGSASNVLSCSTTLSDTINQSPAFYGFIVNSPPETPTNMSNVSIPAGWNYTDGYHVIVSHNAFGAAGFGRVFISLVHNSPSKLIDKPTPTNVCDCVVNTAFAYGTVGGGAPAIYSDPNGAKAKVCFAIPTAGSAGCNITEGATKLAQNTLQLPLKNNNATVAIYMSQLDLSWPAGNGNLVEVDLNGKAWTGSLSSPATLTSANFIANATKIDHGQSKNLVLKFQHNVSTTSSLYTGTVKFGTDSSCIISFP